MWAEWAEVKVTGESVYICFYQRSFVVGKTEEYSSCEVQPEYFESFKHQLHLAIEIAKRNKQENMSNALKAKKEQIEKLKAELEKLEKEVANAPKE